MSSTWLLRVTTIARPSPCAPTNWLMTPTSSSSSEWLPASGEPYLHLTDTLETALKIFDDSGRNRLPVVDGADATRVIGHATHVRALRFFNAELINNQVEEHR